MKHIYKFNSYQKLNESQTKKLRKYFTFSVVLEWYRKNKEMIAKTLGCQVSDLADEDTLMEQSYGVVNHVINPQTSGNEGRESIEIAGFSNFNKLEKNLIHDILHNMYQVQAKEFSKSLERIEYSESEIFEEIEVLGIEESFMKNMNIPYPKTDFINQNINMLASYMMMAILKNDPERIKKILDEEVEPYLEIYGKKYPVEGTPYENFFKLFKNKSADYNFDIDDSSDFKRYMLHLINVGVGISNNGDRAQYPNFDYFGDKDWSSLTEDEAKSYIEYTFKGNRRGIKCICVKNDSDEALKELENRGIIFNIVGEQQTDEINDPNQLKLFPEYEKDIKKKIKISRKAQLTSLSDKNNLSEIPIKREFIDEDGYVDMNSWFSFLEKMYSIELYEIGDDKYLGITYDEKEEKYSIFDSEEFEDYVRDDYESNERDPIEKDTQYINFDEHRNMSFSELAKKIISDDDSRAIMRRNFRTNDVIKNNTKIGSIIRNSYSSYWKQDEVENKKYNYIDFTKSEFAGEKSISKAILTDNGKRLIYLLNNLKGYFIKNITKIKSTYNKKSNKFGKDEINKFRNINLNELKILLNSVQNIDLNINELKVNFQLRYGWSFNNYIQFVPSDEVSAIKDFYTNFKTLKEFKDKVRTKEDSDFLMNYVNEKGLLKTPKDFSKFKTFITKIRKYESIIDKHPYKDEVLKLDTKTNALNKETTEEIKAIIDKDDDVLLDKKIRELLNKYYPSLNIKNISVNDKDRYDLNIAVII